MTNLAAMFICLVGCQQNTPFDKLVLGRVWFILTLLNAILFTFSNRSIIESIEVSALPLPFHVMHISMYLRARYKYFSATDRYKAIFLIICFVVYVSFIKDI